MVSVSADAVLFCNGDPVWAGQNTSAAEESAVYDCGIDMRGLFCWKVSISYRYAL